MRKQSIYEFAKSGNLSAVPQIQSNGTLTDLQKKRNEMQSEYGDALAQFGPNFPKVQRLREQVKEVDNNIEKEKQNIIDTLESEYREAASREMLLAKALEEQKAAVNEMAGKMVEYNILKREAEANKILYDGLLTKLREAGVSGGIEVVQYSNGGPGDGAFDSCAASQDAQRGAGVSGGAGGRNWAGADAGVSGQHGKNSG